MIVAEEGSGGTELLASGEATLDGTTISGSSGGGSSGVALVLAGSSIDVWCHGRRDDLKVFLKGHKLNGAINGVDVGSGHVGLETLECSAGEEAHTGGGLLLELLLTPALTMRV